MASFEYQESYFKYVHLTHPDLSYNSIRREINFNWNVDIVYDNKAFNNMKARLKSNINEITNIHNQLKDVQYKDELLLKVNYSIINNKAERTVIRIYGTNSTLKHFSEPSIKQFFIDGTYKCIPQCDSINVLVLILCHNTKYEF